MQPTFAPETAMITCGLLFFVQASVVWQVLNRRAQRRPVLLWTLGSLSLGCGLVLFGLRGVVADWLGFVVANTLIALSGLIRVEALLAHMQRPSQRFVHLAVVGLYALVHFGLLQGGHTEARVIWTLLVWSLGYTYLAWRVRQAALTLRLRAAHYLAMVEAATAVALLLYTLHVMAGLGPKEAMPETWTFLALFTVLGVSALWGNLGYLGMVVDQYRQADRQLREERLIQTARADQAEQNTQRLQALLAERDALAEDRERLLQVMTHEIRQPLHNASGVLQALREADAETDSVRANIWSTRVDRADAVLGEVRDVLDNVLQAASLLHHREPPPLAPTELAFLIDFCLLDLPLAQRERVDVQWRTELATAHMAQPLIRLALRNLLRNAFAHGGPEVTVQLRIEERHAPHWLVLAVVDDGPGLTPNPPSQESLRTDAGNRPVQERHRSGLGLQIARQVMALHGGRLALENLSAGGFSAALQWPIDQPHADPYPTPRSSEAGPDRA